MSGTSYEQQATRTDQLEVAAERGKRSLIHDPLEGDKNKITLVRARGSLVWDDRGREYLDFTSQAWSNNLGANDPRVIEAAIAQCARSYTRGRISTRCAADLDGETSRYLARWISPYWVLFAWQSGD